MVRMPILRPLTASLAGLMLLTGCGNTLTGSSGNQRTTSTSDGAEDHCFLKTDFISRDPSASGQLRIAQKNGALWSMEKRGQHCHKTLLAQRFNLFKDAQGQPVAYRRINGDSFKRIELDTKTETVFERVEPQPLPPGLGISRFPEPLCLAQATYKTIDRDRHHFHLLIEDDYIYKISFSKGTQHCYKTLTGVLNAPASNEPNESSFKLSGDILTERYYSQRAPGTPGVNVTIRYQRIETLPSQKRP